jgi:hypothetical protein
LINGPYQHAPKTELVGEIDLLLESLFVVIGYPLILVPDNVLDTSLLVVVRLEIVVIDDVDNLSVGQGAGIVTARTGFGAAFEFTAWAEARWLSKLERPPIETKANV